MPALLLLVLARSFRLSRIHLPASLCSTPVTALLRSYGGSDSRLPFSHAAGYPRFTSPECVLSFCAQPPHVFPYPRIALVVSAFRERSHAPAIPAATHRLARLRPSFAGSPRHEAESTFSSYGPTDSPSVALHPAFRRRSYGRLSTSRVFG